jgi:periplasmic protein TonB
MRLPLALIVSLTSHTGLGVALWMWNLNSGGERIEYAVTPGEVIAAKFLSPSAPQSVREQAQEAVKPMEHALPRMDLVAVTRQTLERPIETSPVGTAPSGSTAVVKTEIERAEPQEVQELPEEQVTKVQEAVTKQKQKAPEGAAQPSVAMPLQPATIAGAEVDQLPRKLMTNVPPPYPADALRAGTMGRVRLRVVVREDGKVETAGVLTSSGSASLDEAALAAVRQWRFEPARRGGRSVAAEVVVPVRFWIERG